MNVYVSVNGALRNFIQKFDYHYRDVYLESETENEETPFEYGTNGEVRTIDNYIFQSNDERNNFLYFDYPLEIFGHAGLTIINGATEFNKLIFENPDINFTLIGLDEFGKAKPSTLFFLSKNGVVCSNIKFITTKDIKKNWKECDIWITDDENIISQEPIGKKAIKFNTKYNNHFKHDFEINTINEIKDLWTETAMKRFILIWKQLVKHVSQLRILN